MKDVSDKNQPHEAGILRLSIDKATWSLGWRPGLGFADDGASRTAGWYKTFYQNSAAIHARRPARMTSPHILKPVLVHEP